jgi:drug/metabolite transporter (DMT)-like permease
MLWLILSLLSGLAVSSQDACNKKYFSHLSPYQMSAYPLSYSLPLFAIAILFVPVPQLDATFFWCFAVSIPINAVAYLLYMKALKISPLSLTVPYLAFTPAFMTVTGYLFLDEMPDSWGISGILIVCTGGYILNIDPEKRSFAGPLKAVFKETGSWIMLSVAFIFSFCAVIGKKAILHSSPLFFSLSFFLIFNTLMLLFLMGIRKIDLTSVRKSPLQGIAVGTLLFTEAILHGWAISLIQAAYMISVKRLSVVFGVIYGRLIFKEKNIAFRFSGALLMVIGTILIAFQGG